MKIQSEINQLPTLTWNFLNLNSVHIDEEVPLNHRGDMFIRNIPGGITVRMNGSVLQDVRTGMGDYVNHLMNDHQIETLGLSVSAGQVVSDPVKLNYVLGEGDGILRRQEIVAEEGSEITVVMDYTAGRRESGFFGIQTKLHAKKHALIRLVKVNLLGDRYLHFEDIGGVAEEGGRIELIQLELGGGRNYVGGSFDLKGRKSVFSGNVGYLCRGSQLLDMNYAMNHIGRKTESSLQVKGALRDKAVKNFRGTIDFRRGAAGAVGDEQEDTLLLSPGVDNKTLPIILCDEENVEGTHGASIGRLSEDILFYMNSRGISAHEAEILMTKARLNSVRRLIKDENTLGKIQQFIEEAF
ncbi:MAG: SufD family Fe-S cluster assembly protein [Lachnospiraceae bacterium]|nr:SufD family Fe-S cluster assembly protein [Lachnospiraceae bacterium]